MISTMKAGSDLFGGGVVGLDSWDSREVGAATFACNGLLVDSSHRVVVSVEHSAAGA
ncbi:hypothetical protein [Rhodoglobus aureus]|uniref:Uncharacterized protein n=1 Tax=Rhodoglobus aureus TaxID=191497 RepID=A0ABN1VLS4_9MICO